MYVKKKDRVYRDERTGRMMEHKGKATRIFWSAAMLSYLRRHYPTTKNAELAECLEMSPRTLVRKASALGLRKDPEWLGKVWDEHRQMAHVAYKKKGSPNAFKPGQHNYPAGEFKPGQKSSPETNAKRIAAVKRWCLTHPEELKERGRKVSETKRRKKAEMLNV